MEYVTLNNGKKMPKLGIGTFKFPSNEVAKEAVKTALQNGYRLIDTAHAYNDEIGVGQGIKESGVAREEIFLTSKIWPSEYGEGKTLEAIDKMLKRLDTPYVDLLLLHQPFGDVMNAWRDMEKAVELGKVKSIGLSNFEQYHFEDIMNNAKIKPVLMQVECHPYYQQLELREKLSKYNMQLECWYPVGGEGEGGNKKLFADETIKKIAKNHSKTPAQVILRYEVQSGLIAIPGAYNPNYIKENINIFDFELTKEEMLAMKGLDKKQRFFVSFEGTPYEKLEEMTTGIVLPD